MSKIGISIKLDVKKLDKARFFAAQSGALYVDLTMFLDPDNEGQYGDHGFCTQSTSKEERDNQVQMPILGSGKIFYGLQELKAASHNQPQAQQQGGFQQQAAQQNYSSQTQAQQNQPYNAPQQQGYTQPNQQAKVNPQEQSIDFDGQIPF